MKSKSQNTPFLDQTLKGGVDLVVLGDEILLERSIPRPALLQPDLQQSPQMKKP